MRNVTSALWIVTGLLVAVPYGIAVPKSAGGPPQELPAEASFRDGPDDRIRPVGGPVYSPGVLCVIARVDSKNGAFFLRTTGGACYGATGQFHPLELDFGDPVSPVAPGDCWVDDPFGQVGVLNICGANAVPDVRILASALVQATATETQISIPFNLGPDFRNTAFQLDFEQPVAITDSSAGFRELTAAAGAVVELYSVKRGRKTSLGRFRMPFQMTVVLLPQ